MHELRISSWHLASLALPMAALGCGPLIPIDGTGTDTDVSTDPTQSSSPTDPSDPSDPSNPSDPSGPDSGPTNCYQVPCGYGYKCIAGVCEPYYYCLDFCCGEGGGCCYYDDGGCYTGVCNTNADCDAGQYCRNDYCYQALVLPACDDAVLAPPIPLAAGISVTSLSFMDGDGDAARELVIGHADGAQVLSGGGTAVVELPLMAGIQVDDVGVGDLDGDGDQDIALATSGSIAGLVFFFNDGAGNFGLGAAPTSIVRRLELADLDGDGLGDLMVEADFGGPSTELAVMANLGTGFDAPYIHSSGGALEDFAIGRVYQDPTPDLVVAGDEDLRIYRGGPLDGTTDAYISGVGALPTGVAVGDVDGDGAADVLRVSTNYGIALWEAFRSDGGFAEQPKVRVDGDYHRMVAGDLDGDARDDVVLASDGGALVVLRAGDGFATPVTCMAEFDGPGPVLAAGDLDGDGRIDIAQGGGAAVHLWSGAN